MSPISGARPEPASNLLSDLCDAAQSGDLEQLNTILTVWQAQIAPETISPDEISEALHEAISANQIPAVSFLLSRGAKIDKWVAGEARQANASTDMYQTFIDHGWDVNSKDVRGRPFVQTVLGNEPLAEFLLDHGADIDARSDRWDTTSLDVAAAANGVAVVKFLLAHGAKIAGANPLHQAASSSTETHDQQEMMAFLIDEVGIDINALSTFGHRINKVNGDENGTPLHAAIRSGEEHRINFFLDRGADPEMKNEMGETPLEYARRWGFAEGVRILEERMPGTG